MGEAEAEVHLTARGRAYLTETRGTWLRLKRCGRDDEADDPPGQDLRSLGRDLIRLGQDLRRLGRDHWDLVDDRPLPWELGRRPTPTTVNAQTKISEVNPSSTIR